MRFEACLAASGLYKKSLVDNLLWLYSQTLLSFDSLFLKCSNKWGKQNKNTCISLAKFSVSSSRLSSHKWIRKLRFCHRNSYQKYFYSKYSGSKDQYEYNLIVKENKFLSISTSWYRYTDVDTIQWCLWIVLSHITWLYWVSIFH